MTIFVEDSFDSAHFLPNVPRGHKCGSIHGHTYRIRIEVRGDVGPVTGWVIDYGDIRAQWLPIKDQLDHQHLNYIIPNPTCELIAEWIGERLPCASRIELRETEHCGVVWERE